MTDDTAIHLQKVRDLSDEARVTADVLSAREKSRDTAIVEAANAGVTVRSLVRATKLSRARIYQIIDKWAAGAR